MEEGLCEKTDAVTPRNTPKRPLIRFIGLTIVTRQTEIFFQRIYLTDPQVWYKSAGGSDGNSDRWGSVPMTVQFGNTRKTLS